MSLFTANGLLYASTRGTYYGICAPIHTYMAYFYEDWLETQGVPSVSGKRPSWLKNIPQLRARRAPGLTCLKYSIVENNGTIEEPCNQSKGCGGIMRVAPVGLFLRPRRFDIRRVDRIGADIAALTHGHPLGYIPAAMLVHIINRIVHFGYDLVDAILDAKGTMPELFGNNEYVEGLNNLISEAMDMAIAGDVEDIEAIHRLGEGWVAEEALAISVYCALRHRDDFMDAVIAAVNHGGDSDSTGAITGNIMGSLLGANGIPETVFDGVELSRLITDIACDLYRFEPPCEDGPGDTVWKSKYVFGTYPYR